MRQKGLLPFFLASLMIVLAMGCGVGTNKRLFTRPSDYYEMMTFPTSDNPFDLEHLIREYPELKGRVVKAEDVTFELVRQAEEAERSGALYRAFRFSTGDTFSLEVPGASEFSRSVTVGPDGFNYFPHIGKVTIVNKTVDELRQELTQLLSKYYVKPEVIINVAGQANVTTGFVIGSGGQVLASPTALGGNYIVVLGVVGSRTFANIPYTGKETLVNVLGQTTLPGTAAWRQIRVIRRTGKTVQERLQKGRIIICDMWSYLALGDVRQDIPLEAGDVLLVPPRWTTYDQFWKEDWDAMTKIINMTNVNDDFIQRYFSPLKHK